MCQWTKPGNKCGQDIERKIGRPIRKFASWLDGLH
jgi:hypothetical protein